MDKKEFLKFFEENRDRFIPGIFNYCDRWCERCTMAEKCSLYAMEKEEISDSTVELTLDNKELWNHLGNMMAIAHELIMDFAKENGIDLDSVSVEDEMAEWEKTKKEIDKHPLSKKSFHYVETCKKWFEENRAAIDSLAAELNKKAELELSPAQTLSQAKEINDYLEVVHWYQFQIHVKIKRALTPSIIQDPEKDLVQNDNNGSAKVALLGTNRSIAAWYGLFKYLPQFEDDILNVLVTLENIRNGIEEAFPNVHRFVRPGFDE
jgi:hypothetical protein